MDERKCPLSKEIVKSYYSDPRVRSAIFNQCLDRFVCLRFDWGMVRHPTRVELNSKADFPGVDGKRFIAFRTNDGTKHSPTDLSYWVNRGTIEFIPEVTRWTDLDRADNFVIDLDPKSEDFSFDDLKKSTLLVLEAILASSLRPQIKELNVRFSGNRSFHLYFRLTGIMALKDIREQVKVTLDVLESQHKDLSYHNVRDRTDFILIDIGAIARHRCVRSLFSLHAKTGRCCVPLHRNQIQDFDPATATIENVLAGHFNFGDIISPA